MAALDLIRIEREIMAAKPTVEQVGFYWFDAEGSLRACLAGRELCGNFLRDLAYLLYLRSNKKLDTVTINLETQLGVLEIPAGVNKAGEAWATLPILGSFAGKTTGSTIVEMTGITLVVVPTPLSSNLDNEELKKLTQTILARENLLDGPPATGVIFSNTIESNNNQIRAIRPFIRVTKRQEIFPESACGTGTIVVTFVNFLRTGESFLEVMQPSGQSIYSAINQENGAYSAMISGKVQRLKA